MCMTKNNNIESQMRIRPRMSDFTVYVFIYRYYTKAQRVLLQYQHMPSFQGINTDCSKIISQLSSTLKERFRNKEVWYNDVSLIRTTSTVTKSDLNSRRPIYNKMIFWGPKIGGHKSRPI